MTDTNEAGKEEFENADGPVIICQHPHKPNDAGRGEFDYDHDRAGSVSSMTLSDHGQTFFTSPPRMDTKTKKTLLEQERYAASEASDDEGENGGGGDVNEVQMSQAEKVATVQEEEALRNRRLWGLRNMMGMKSNGSGGKIAENSNVKGYQTDGDKTRHMGNVTSGGRNDRAQAEPRSPYDANSVVERALASTNSRPGVNSITESTELTEPRDNHVHGSGGSPNDRDAANDNSNYDATNRSIRAAKNRRNRGGAAQNNNNSDSNSVSSHMNKLKHEHTSVDPDSATITSFSNQREKLSMDDLCRNLEEEVIRLKLELAQAKGLVDEALMSCKRESEEKYKLALYSRQLEDDARDRRHVSESLEAENKNLKGKIMGLIQENGDLKQTLEEGRKGSGSRRISNKQMWGSGRG
eukprot:CAMPEP_0194383506 /NCGR_PEP_ID=MMETSP0174-20130528/67744_1 /TAXON_ID=216777 /ORGANISM="Proboscia alata, Strain PI-D3" /LENGTH=409 /DNA_ID=CAMNT_0039169795 /DNA_START=27 /DNA_END=1256 /DNA_ORIENTATION=+